MKKRGIKRRTKFFVKFYLGATLLIMFAFLVFSLMTIVLVTNQWWDEKIDMLDMNCHSIAEDYTKVLQTTDSEGRDRALNVLVLGNDMEAFSKATEADYFITDLNGNIIVCRHFFDNNGKKCEEHSKIKLKSELVEGTKQGGVTELTGLEEGVDGTDFVVGVPVSYGGKVVAEVFGTIDAVGGLLPYVASLSEMILIAALLTLILAFLIIYAYSRTYTRPIVDMIEATDHYAKSDFTYHIDDRKLDGEMAEMARALNRMAGEIAIYDQTQKSFVANVSHELKTPMTTIGGFVDGILDGTIPKEKEKEYLSTVSSEVKRLARLVVAMLNLSKMESGEIGITPVKYRIQTQIFEALFSMEQRINDKNITINGLEEIDDVKIVAYRELPVRARLALRDDCLGELARRDDFAGHCEMPVGDLRPDEPDAPQRVVFVVRQKRHGFGDRHPRQVHDHGVRPSKEAHLSATVGESRDGVLAARTLCCGYF